jgi:hypothetical protein
MFWIENVAAFFLNLVKVKTKKLTLKKKRQNVLLYETE